MRALLAVIVLLLVTLCGPRVATAEPPLAHPDMPSPNDADRIAPLAPIHVGARTFYAYGADVLEWSDADKAVIARTRMPARIASIAPEGDSTMKLVLVVPGPARERFETVWKIDGQKPGRGYFGFIDCYRTRREARALAFGFDPERGDIDVAHRDEAIAALAAREQVDHANPFLPALRGQLLSRAGRTSEAKVAFAIAADTRGAAFDDLLRVSTILEDEGESELAERAFDRGFEGMKQAGLRPELVEAVVVMQVFVSVPRRALLAALAANDVARVDRIVARYARAFPKVEGASSVYRDLAAWMRSKGRADLGTVWSVRADAAEGAAANAITREQLYEINRLELLALGAAVVAPLVAFVVGARRGSGKRGRGVLVDVLTAAAPMALLIVAASLANARTDAIGRAAVMPTALLADASASPEVAHYLETRLQPGAERDAVLSWARAEAEATKAGSRSDRPPPSDATIRAAVNKTAWGESFAAAMRPSRESRPLTPLVVLVMSTIAAFLGWLLGTKAPRAAVAAARVIPGGPASLGIVGPVLGAIFVAASFAFAGADRALASLSPASAAKWFGLETIASTPPMPSRGWAWVFGVGYVVVHLVGITLDRLRERRA